MVIRRSVHLFAHSDLLTWRSAKCPVLASIREPAVDEEKAIARRLNKAALDHVVYAPLGFFLTHQAWRRNVTGIVKGPLPFFWGVSKSA
jgi:peptide/nickel transport system substrate-binding protein